MGTSLRNRLCTFQTFSALYQVKQLPESREVRFKLFFFLELTSAGTALEFKRKILKFIALPFPFSSRLNWSYHVGGWQRNVQKSVMHVQSCCFANLTLLRFWPLPSSQVPFKFCLRCTPPQVTSGHTSLPSPRVNINFGETILFVACRITMILFCSSFRIVCQGMGIALVLNLLNRESNDSSRNRVLLCLRKEKPEVTKYFISR